MNRFRPAQPADEKSDADGKVEIVKGNNGFPDVHVKPKKRAG